MDDQHCNMVASTFHPHVDASDEIQNEDEPCHSGREQSPHQSSVDFNLMTHCDSIVQDIHHCIEGMAKPCIAYYYPPEEVGRFGSSIHLAWDRVNIYFDARQRHSRVVAAKPIRQGQLVTLHRVDHVMSLDQQSIYDCEAQQWIHRHDIKPSKFTMIEKKMLKEPIRCHGYMIASQSNHMMPMYAGQYIHDAYKLGFKRLYDCLSLENPYAKLIEYKRILIDYYRHSLQQSNVIRTQYNHVPIMFYVATRDIESGEQIFMTHSHQRWINRYKMMRRGCLASMDRIIRFDKWFPMLLDDVRHGRSTDDYDRYKLNPEFLEGHSIDQVNDSINNHTHSDLSSNVDDDDDDRSAHEDFNETEPKDEFE